MWWNKKKDETAEITDLQNEEQTEKEEESLLEKIDGMDEKQLLKLLVLLIWDQNVEELSEFESYSELVDYIKKKPNQSEVEQ